MAITELKDRLGSSIHKIKQYIQSTMPPNKKWLNSVYLNTLKKMVADCELVQVKNSYKLSAGYKKKVKDEQRKAERFERQTLKENERIQKQKLQAKERTETKKQ